MSTPILATKLYIPPPRPQTVQRTDLMQQINDGLQCKLTLISAPAGFGKTTLVTEWIANCQRPAAWLSLNEGDNNPTHFLVYLIAALQTIAPNCGENALAMLHSPQPAPTESILTTLLNNITTIPEDFTLILDDYHVINNQEINTTLAFLLEHLPPQMHLIITTREDPLLPLARYRVQRQLTELRAIDLRFTPTETAVFLNQIIGLNLSADDLAALETRTEGWIAGLQMVALAMQQGQINKTQFIQAFTGSHRFVLDYLVEEVLQRQSEDVRSFLLQTAILDRLNGSLCDAVRFGIVETVDDSPQTAVSNPNNSKIMLATLERDNLFIIPLDDKRQWYRYHHLFADVLQTHLKEQQPNQVTTLHRRASKWYEQNNLPADAIHHALAAEDFIQAASLIERAWPTMTESYQSITWLNWAKAIPDELTRARPVLSVGYAYALLNIGQLEAADSKLQDAEQWLQPELPASKMIIADEAQFQSLPASIAIARAYLAQAHGDSVNTIKHAQQALSLLPKEDYPNRGSVTALLGLAYWTHGDLEDAYQIFSDSLASMPPPDIITGTFVLADIKITQGQRHAAMNLYEKALQLVQEHGEPTPSGTEFLYPGISELHREQGDLETAVQDLNTGKKIGEHVELPVWQYRWHIAQARLKESQGELETALDLLGKAEHLYIRTPVPILQPIPAMKTRVWIKQGKLSQALNWAHEQGLSIDDDLSYLREFEHITLAKIHIAQYKNNPENNSIDEAIRLIERLLNAAESGQRTGSVIETRMLQALAHEAQGDVPTAIASLEHALTLAKPEGYFQLFVDEGSPMAHLLYEALSHKITPAYIQRLLAAFPIDQPKQGIPPNTNPTEVALLETLSKREHEVLQLIAEGLTNQEIANKLYLSLHTVKVHARNIYAKLGVKNRTQAVAKGKALGILSSP